MVYNVCYMTSSIVLKQCVGGEGGVRSGNVGEWGQATFLQWKS